MDERFSLKYVKSDHCGILLLNLILALLAFGFASCKAETFQGAKISETRDTESIARVNEMVAECRVCHGLAEAQRGPILDGMEYWYLYEQLQKFRSGIRGQNPENRSEHLMGVGVKKLSSDIEAAYLADWFSHQEPKAAVRTVRGDLEKGKLLYDSRCASCHGPEAQGNRLVGGPALNRLEGWYFLEQMRKFLSDKRGYHPLDESGQVMAAAAKGLPDSSFRDVTAYIVISFGPEDAPSLRDRFVPEKSEKPF